MNSVKAKVIQILKDELGFEEIKTSDKFRYDLNCDSLDIIELTVELEDEFEINISDTEINRLTNGTVGELIQYIEEWVR